jgi:hypothetical protein
MKNHELLACAAAVSGPGNCPLGEEGEMMVELISAIDGLCRRLDWKKDSK